MSTSECLTWLYSCTLLSIRKSSAKSVILNFSIDPSSTNTTERCCFFSALTHKYKIFHPILIFFGIYSVVDSFHCLALANKII